MHESYFLFFKCKDVVRTLDDDINMNANATERRGENIIPVAHTSTSPPRGKLKAMRKPELPSPMPSSLVHTTRKEEDTMVPATKLGRH